MTKKYIFLTIFFLCFTFLYADSSQIRTGITVFSNLSKQAEDLNLGLKATRIIEKDISEFSWYQIRKSNDIKKFIDVMEKVQLGLLKPSALDKYKNNLQVDYLTVGSVADYNGNIEIDVRTININTWAIIHSSGINAFDYKSACNYIKKDMQITFKPEDLHSKEKELEKVKSVSVLKFTDSNEAAIKSGYSSIFSEVLNSELGAGHELKVIERTHAKSIINEKAFIMAGIIENDNSINVFQEAGIDYKIEGDIYQNGSLICINYRIIGVKSRRLVFLGHEEISSVAGLRPIASKIAKKVSSSLTEKIGTLELTIEPGYATTFIDGNKFQGSKILTSLEKGLHIIKIELPGYQTFEKEITIVPKEINTLNVNLNEIDRTQLLNAQASEQYKNWTKAIKQYQLYINQKGISDYDYNFSLYRIGFIYQNRLKEYEKAMEKYDSLIKRYPDSLTRSEAMYGYAQCLNAIGKNEESQKMIKDIVKLYPESTAAFEINNK